MYRKSMQDRGNKRTNEPKIKKTIELHLDKDVYDEFALIAAKKSLGAKEPLYELIYKSIEAGELLECVCNDEKRESIRKEERE
jgi:hypothetical protein